MSAAPFFCRFRFYFVLDRLLFNQRISEAIGTENSFQFNPPQADRMETNYVFRAIRDNLLGTDHHNF